MTMIALYNDALTVFALFIPAAGLAWTVVELACRVRLNRLPDEAELQRRMLREIREHVVARRAAAAFYRDVVESSRKLAREFGVPDIMPRRSTFHYDWPPRKQCSDGVLGGQGGGGHWSGGQGGCSFYPTPSEMRYLRDHEEGKR